MRHGDGQTEANGGPAGGGQIPKRRGGLRFVKMHGAGNDYIYIDTIDQEIDDPARLARVMSDRHFGVGGDGLILIRPSATADARMEMYNADGSRGRMCGNGIRCVAKLLFDRRRAPARMTIETDSGVRRIELFIRDGVATAARVEMGVPELAPSRIGLAPPLAGRDRPLLDWPLEVAGQTVPLTVLSVGNPHAVCFVQDLARAALDRLGPLIEHHPLFPERMNVSFAQVLGPSRLGQRTWERGSGETLACGTGATAGAVAAVQTGRAVSPVTVSLPGGDLTVDWRGEGHHAWLTGPAEEVFEGRWPGA